MISVRWDIKEKRSWARMRLLLKIGPHWFHLTQREAEKLAKDIAEKLKAK